SPLVAWGPSPPRSGRPRAAVPARPIRMSRRRGTPGARNGRRDGGRPAGRRTGLVGSRLPPPLEFAQVPDRPGRLAVEELIEQDGGFRAGHPLPGRRHEPAAETLPEAAVVREIE